MTAAPLIVVDATNVVGSRPDGWWRDRPGAARRLLTTVSALPDQGEAVVVVLEGAARPAAEPGVHDGVLVVHAPGSGDDEIVRVVAEALTVDPERSVVVVTADRELRDRVRALNAETVGPRWLWDRLDGA